MTRAEADAEEAKGNYVTEVPGKGWQRIVSAPKPVGIVEIDTIRTLMDADRSLSPAEVAVSRLWSRAVSCAAPALSLKKI
mgnify:CR=1 FL=1